MTTFTGTDIFNRPVTATHGNDKSVIVARVAKDNSDDENDVDVLTLSPQTAAALGRWLTELNQEPSNA